MATVATWHCDWHCCGGRCCLCLRGSLQHPRLKGERSPALLLLQATWRGWDSSQGAAAQQAGDSPPSKGTQAMIPCTASPTVRSPPSTLCSPHPLAPHLHARPFPALWLSHRPHCPATGHTCTSPPSPSGPAGQPAPKGGPGSCWPCLSGILEHSFLDSPCWRGWAVVAAAPTSLTVVGPPSAGQRGAHDPEKMKTEIQRGLVLR